MNMKHLHLFESHNNELDMPINPSFVNYKKYEPYLNNPNVYDLVNALNQLWYDMEQMPTDDDTQNEVGRQLEALEAEINREIITSASQQEDDELNEEQQQIVEDVTQLMNDVFSEFNLQIQDSGYDEDSDEVWVEVDIDGEEVEFRINNRHVYLEDFDDDIKMGYLYYDFERYHKNYDSTYPDFRNMFKEYLAAEGETYQDFIAAHK